MNAFQRTTVAALSLTCAACPPGEANVPDTGIIVDTDAVGGGDASEVGADADGPALDSGITRLPDAHLASDAPSTPTTCAVPPAASDTTTAPAAWEFHRLESERHPTALCNDGSAGAYVFRPNAASTRWLIFLEGGGACYDGATCLSRWREVAGDPDAGNHDKMTSDDDAAGWMDGSGAVPTEGVFSSSHAMGEVWRNANIVRVSYCSSDIWSGDREGNPMLAESDVGHWHFRGRSIVTAVLDDLTRDHGLDTATDVVLAGGSAGGAGVYNLVDDVAALVPPTARFMGIPDAGFQVDYPRLGARPGAPTPLQRLGTLGSVAWGGRGDASCVDAAAGDAVATLLCRSAVELLTNRHISTPLLSVVSELDQVQLNRLAVDIRDERGCRVTDSAERDYALEFFNDGMLPALGGVAPDRPYSVFADYTCAHVMINGPDSRVWEADGASLADVIRSFHDDPCAPARHIDPMGGAIP